MAIETWNSPYIVFLLCFGALMTVLTYGVQGYNGKVNRLGATGYSMLIGALSILDGAALGQYMYDEKAKYDVWGSLGSALGLSGPLIVSGLILLVFYRYRVVKHPEEVAIKGNDVEVAFSGLLSGVFTLLLFGVMLLGIGMGNFVVELVGDRKGAIYALYIFAPPVVAFWVMAKYRKWIFKYIVWVLRRKGLLQEIKEEQ